MKTKILFALTLAVGVLGGSAVTSTAIAQDGVSPKVTGDDCIPPVPEIGYRPSLFECNGAAAILLRGHLRDSYSVVVRRGNHAQFNDRDPNNTGCALAECSPYKVQKKIELPEYRISCLGDSGYSDSFATVTRISVKFSAAVSDSLDPSQFQQYCIANTQQGFN